MPTNATYAQLANAAYDPANSALPSGWELLRTPPYNPAGYDGAAFARRDVSGNVVEIVVAHRGTEPLTFDGDWASNLQMGANQLPAQYQYAQQFLADVIAANPGAPVSIIGHSLGGALAQLTAAATGLSATTFNAYGAKDLMPGLNFDPNATYGNITNHQTLLDPVSRLPGSSHIGEMHTHVAPSEAPIWAVALAIGRLPVITGVAITGASVWSHGVGRFGEIYSDPAKAIIDAGMKIGDFINGIEQSVSSVFTAAQRWVRPVFRDPLTFDLNGNGLETVPISPSNPILFDHTGSGIKAGTGWIAPSDGFLVLDRNGNGMIDNGTELFGDSTPLASGGKAEDGFAALAQEDSNGDGEVNNHDTNWGNLRVWQDSNQDGISQGNELKTLDELGIASIKVGKIEHSSILPNGNEIADLGSFTRTDGSAGGMGVTSGLADVNLAADTFHRSFTDIIPATPQTGTLPDMRGSGVVRDLREAASLPTPEGARLRKQEGGMKWRIQKCLLLALLLPLGARAAEPAKGVPFPAIDPTLPIHQQKKLHPELSDPVLGDQAQIVEWAWSPQYAKRFNLPEQPDGLKDGGLWLVGVKIARKQYQQWQTYTCNIVGVMDNTLPILAPPGEVYVIHPSHMNGMPGKAQVGSADLKNEVQHQGVQAFTPAQATWNKKPKNELEQTRSERNIGLNYLFYYRQFQKGLAYFEIEGGCAYFNDPELFRNEIRFPARFIHENRTAVFEPDAIRFDIPDSLMRRIYPYTLDAYDWTSCMMRRTGRPGVTLTLRATKSKRFGNTCEPVTQPAK